MRERSISDTLWDLGVTHDRDEGSKTDQCHTLYYAGRSIGRYSAHDVACLIRELGFDDDHRDDTARSALLGRDAG